ncbi:4'-phosphopantetheinyl transferase superfamily protein [Hazenella coriacea]|uniref:4'-phosphopantetheinyl transferase superfamily protein n=2 Tax=Hazenella coriacea TaxID=1179467 RepID=A0A4R3L274_9BACL|nr:4'-phosphopantetheinyl transferase superfamily protein [Hazenella coriacea]
MVYRNDSFKKSDALAGYTYTDNFVLKSSKENYKVYINFYKRGNGPIHCDNNDFLHEDEKKYFKTLVYERRINSYLLGRYSAKKAVSAFIEEDNLKKILIKNGVFNQPVVVCEPYSNIQVSLTHCEDLAAAAAFNDLLMIGIDIEKIQQSLHRGVEAELTQYEKELLHQVPCSYESFLLLIWTIKESLSKALKTGLTVSLSVLEVQSIEVNDGYYLSTFTHFDQYHTISFIVKDYAFSMTYPKNVEIDIDIYRIKQKVEKIISHSLVD